MGSEIEGILITNLRKAGVWIKVGETKVVNGKRVRTVDLYDTEGSPSPETFFNGDSIVIGLLEDQK
jgi:hypothetical protein